MPSATDVLREIRNQVLPAADRHDRPDQRVLKLSDADDCATNSATDTVRRILSIVDLLTAFEPPQTFTARIARPPVRLSATSAATTTGATTVHVPPFWPVPASDAAALPDDIQLAVNALIFAAADVAYNQLEIGDARPQIELAGTFFRSPSRSSTRTRNCLEESVLPNFTPGGARRKEGGRSRVRSTTGDRTIRRE